MKNQEQSCWDILGIPQTKNQSKIRKAYTGKSKRTHPEEQPEAFLLLKNAYDQAKNFATSKQPEPSPVPKLGMDCPAQIAFIQDLLSKNLSREEWKAEFLSFRFLSFFVHPNLEETLTPLLRYVVEDATQKKGQQSNFFHYFFLAYQINPQIPDPIPVAGGEYLKGLSLFFLLLTPPELTEDDIRFAVAFRCLIQLCGRATAERSVSSIGGYQNLFHTVRQCETPETQQYLYQIYEFARLYHFTTQDKDFSIEKVNQDMMDVLQVEKGSPSETQFPAFYQSYHQSESPFSSHQDELDWYLQQFQEKLASTPKKQQNTLTFVQPFFQGLTYFFSGLLADPRLAQRDSLKNLIHSTTNRLFLVKFLKILLDNDNCQELKDHIIQVIWDDAPKDLSALDALETKILEETTHEEGESDL